MPYIKQDVGEQLEEGLSAPKEDKAIMDSGDIPRYILILPVERKGYNWKDSNAAVYGEQYPEEEANE